MADETKIQKLTREVIEATQEAALAHDARMRQDDPETRKRYEASRKRFDEAVEAWDNVFRRLAQ